MEILRLLRRDEPEPDGGQRVEVRRQRVGADLAGGLHQPRQDVAGRTAPRRCAQSPRREQTFSPSELSVRIVGRNPAVRSRSCSAAMHVVGHGGDEPRLVAPVDQQVPDPLGQHPRLPRPRRGDDPGRARRDGPPPPADPGASSAVGRRRMYRSAGVEESRARRRSMRDSRVGRPPPAERRRTGRRGPPSHQAGRAVGEDDVGAARRGWRRAGRPATPRHQTGSPGLRAS